MNCKSFEFYKNEIEELEKQYFDSLDEAAKEVDEVEALMDKEIEAEENGDSLHHRINFNKLKNAAEMGQRYLKASIKFEKEMKTMMNLSIQRVLTPSQTCSINSLRNRKFKTLKITETLCLIKTYILADRMRLTNTQS